MFINNGRRFAGEDVFEAYVFDVEAGYPIITVYPVGGYFIGSIYGEFPYAAYGKEYVSLFNWTGQGWKRERRRMKKARRFVVKPGDDFFVVDHPSNENLSYFQWNGETWESVAQNKDFGKHDVRVKTGTDFFAANYDVRRYGPCWWSRRKHDKFSLFNWDGDNWRKTYVGRLGLGKRREKKFVIGDDFVVGYRTRTSRRNLASRLLLNASSWNSLGWGASECLFSIPSPDRDRYRLKETPVTAYYRSFAAVRELWLGAWVGHGCDDWAAGGKLRWPALDRVLFAKKYQDGFPDKAYCFGVVEKRVYDGIVTEAPSLATRYEYGNDQEKLYFNTNTGSAMHRQVDVIGSDDSRRQYWFINDDKRLMGRVDTVKNLDKHGNVATTTVVEYSTNISGSEWPQGINSAVVQRQVEWREGVEKATSFEYNTDNGAVRLIRTYASDGKRKIEETKFACETYPSSGMADSNMIRQVSQSIRYQRNDDADPIPDDAVSSSVSTWEYNTNCDAYVPCTTFVWKDQADATGHYPAVPAFHFGNHSQNHTSWRKVTANSAFSKPGMILETEHLKAVGDTPVWSCVYYGHKNALPVARAENARWGECAFLPCDYDNHEEEGGVTYFDLENGWEKGGSFLAVAPVQHFGDSVVWVESSNQGPTKQVGEIDPQRTYIFSAWLYPNTVNETSPVRMRVLKSTTQQDPGAADDHTITDLPAGRWTLHLRRITPDMMADMGAGDYLELRLSSDAGSDFYVEDIRFYPADAMVSTVFYDTLWNKPVTEVDSRNHAVQTEYDARGRPVRTFERDAVGVATVLDTTEYGLMRCNLEPADNKLRKLEVSDVALAFDPAQNTYTVRVPNYYTEVDISAVANNSDAYVSLQGARSVCPCPLAKTVSLTEGSNTPVEVSVEPQWGNANQYTLNIFRETNCWAYSAGTEVAGDRVSAVDVFFHAGSPVVAYVDGQGENPVARYAGGDNWVQVGGAPVSGGASAWLSACSDGSSMYAAYDDGDNDGRATVKTSSGFADSWTVLGQPVSETMASAGVIAADAAGIWIAYVADRYQELEITPPEEGQREYRLFVKKWDTGTSAWVPQPSADDGIVAPEGVGRFDLKLAADGTPYLAYVYSDNDEEPGEDPEHEDDDSPADPNEALLFVLRYQAEQWEAVGSGDPVSETFSHELSLDIDGATPRVAYTEDADIDDPAGPAAAHSIREKLVVKEFDGADWVALKDPGGSEILLLTGMI